MRFESIEITNYRQYQHVCFEFPKKTEYDLHLIVASNGIGKTNLLNAINWCLYDDEPHLDNKEESVTMANHASIFEAERNGDTEIEIAVVIRATAGSETIEFKRSAMAVVQTKFVQKSKLSVTVFGVDGNTVILVGDEAKLKVNQYLPQPIREYFFFDGERLINYFGARRNSTNVTDSIYSIAQINVVHSAVMHMHEMEKQYNREISRANPNVGLLTEKRDTKQRELDEINETIERLKDSISQAKERIAELDVLISGQEHLVTYTNKYNENESRIEEYREDRKQVIYKMEAMVRKYYVLLSFYQENERTNEYIQSKADSGKLPPLVDVDEILRRSLDDKICRVCGQSIQSGSHAEEHIRAIISQLEFSTSVSNRLSSMKNDVYRFVHDARGYSAEKDAMLRELSGIDEKIAKLEEENENILIQLGGNVDTQQIESFMDERKHLKEQVETDNYRVGAHSNRYEQVESELASIEQDLRRAIESVEHIDEVRAKYNVAVEAKRILEEIEQEIIDEVRLRMKEETKAYFDEMIWKKHTYGDISFDDSFRLHVFHAVTGEPCLGTASASEKQLLALAFTLALHKVSGHDAPLFIDTPVGRVSDANRANFGETLVPISKYKQLMLTFTPDEFSVDIQRFFKPGVFSTRIRLDNDEQKTWVEDYENE